MSRSNADSYRSLGWRNEWNRVARGRSRSGEAGGEFPSRNALRRLNINCQIDEYALQATAIPGRSKKRQADAPHWPRLLRQLPVVLASTSAHADAKSWFGPSAFGIVAQPAFMTKSRCSYVDLMALNAFSLAIPSGSTCD